MRLIGFNSPITVTAHFDITGLNPRVVLAMTQVTLKLASVAAIDAIIVYDKAAMTDSGERGVLN